MSSFKNNPSSKMADMLISDLFKKHNIKPSSKNKLSSDEKQQILNLLNDLTKQVNDFVSKNNKKKQEKKLPVYRRTGSFFKLFYHF